MNSATDVVRDAGGEPLAYYEEEHREGVRWAQDLCPAEGAPLAAVAERVVVDLAGWGATTQALLGRALAERGASLEREFDTYTHALRESSKPPEPVRLPEKLAPFAAQAVDPQTLRAAYQAAYPPGHPDHDMSTYDDLRRLMDGTLMGPLLPTSTVLIDTERDTAVAAVLAHDCPGAPPLEGPWISEVFRDPEPACRGIGSLLLRHVLWLSAEAGLPALGLSVTAGNPAARHYERLGFVRTEQWADLRIH
ncbi:GNAT family N-acetyltransferase [Kitasatospora purpeofusca]|uniref:GNAT family N-acetyltransferase n=2 Tax=Kitasatospora purpeofusca TaxID=67352 RepID=UPI002E161BF4|nr:GNAT family N-acetyltransferase [Kitasatospora purpeofusca]